MTPNSSKQKNMKPVRYTKIPGYQGLCHVWDWSDTRSSYVKRTVGGRFHAYKKIRGIQKSKTFESFEKARAWRESASLFEVQSDDSEILFRDVLERFFAHKATELRISTLETYRSNAKHLKFFEPLPMDQITPKAVDAWLAYVKRSEYLRSQHLSRVTYRHELSVLRQVLVYFAEYVSDAYVMPLKKRHLKDAIVDQFKYKRAKAANQSRFIPRADTEKFLDQIRQRAETKPSLAVFAALAVFQLRTGTRIGEACAIDWRDIDCESGAVSISKTVQWSRAKGRATQVSPLTKTGEPRSVPMPSQVIAEIRRWKAECGRSAGLVFSVTGFEPLSYRSIQHQYNGAFRRAGLSWSSTHILRHSFATDFLEKTQNQHALQKVLGHRNSKQTEHYAKITQSIAEAGMRSYDESFRTPNVVKIDARKTSDMPARLVHAGNWEGEKKTSGESAGNDERV